MTLGDPCEWVVQPPKGYDPQAKNVSSILYELN